MNRKRSLVIVMVVLFLLAGCASTSSTTPAAGDSGIATAWKALNTDKAVYDAAFTALGLLDKQGKLPADVKAKAIQYGNVYVAAHNQAVQSLMDGKVPDVKVVDAALTKFIETAGPYTKGK